ncbi:PP2C family protein-serine/threonine phosphatase [Corallincola spongiicola]|uniref:Serine/threonine-protein phosphatase n=1 Tax=Corallincola spongiicola TaxID=2520508 RepID=A0ABY1WPL7_9GAMM|nr:protein phosphatase 2C domain-containing protein [Corallincola spongiicola]TAA45883.1 serine/threonine-protein phosphatase [Corallincola spongiicola]
MALTPLMAGAQIQGARDYQEDSFGHWLVNDDGDMLLLVADGMGGHAAGDTASLLAKETFLNHYQNSTPAPASVMLRDALNAANGAITEHIANNPGHEGMGCTLLAALISEQAITWVSVGDSPMWLLRHGELKRLNEDHSMLPVLQGLVELGRMTEEELAKDSRRNALRSALCGDQLSLIDQPKMPVPLQAGDQILLASDGVQTLSDKAIAEQLSAQSSDPAAGVRRLLAAVDAANAPGQDNATAVLAEIPASANTPHQHKQASSSKILPAVGAVIVAAVLGWWLLTPTPDCDASDGICADPASETQLTAPAIIEPETAADTELVAPETIEITPEVAPEVPEIVPEKGLEDKAMEQAVPEDADDAIPLDKPQAVLKVPSNSVPPKENAPKKNNE